MGLAHNKVIGVITAVNSSAKQTSLLHFLFCFPMNNICLVIFPSLLLSAMEFLELTLDCTYADNEYMYQE